MRAALRRYWFPLLLAVLVASLLVGWAVGFVHFYWGGPSPAPARVTQQPIDPGLT